MSNVPAVPRTAAPGSWAQPPQRPANATTPPPATSQGATRGGANGVPSYDPEAVRRSFEQILRHLTADGVSDVHFEGNRVAWTVKYGRTIKSTVKVSDTDVLVWADLFGAARGGGSELLHGVAGTVEAMAVIGPVGAQLRLRMTFRRQVQGLGLTLRIVPEVPPRITDAIFHDNPIPEALVGITLSAPAGLILFCGRTGSGKTTMNAALLAEVNNTQQKHIYTVEDPIEFVHTSDMSLVTQREIGTHADTFPHALRTSLRSRPNIILVGELLDLETVRVAIEAANKGHLVFATSHASSVEEAVSSLVSQFPGSEQNQVATALSQALKAIVVQRLVPTVDERLVPAREFMINNVAISSKIRDMQFTALTQALKPTDGMWTFEDDLTRLCVQGKITETAAYKECNDRRSLEGKLNFARTQN